MVATKEKQTSFCIFGKSPMKTLTDFKTSNYFTGMPYVIGFVIIPIGLLLLFSPKIIAALVLFAVGIGILTTHFRLTVNQSTKKYTEYISLFGLKVGKGISRFEEIQYLYIKRKKVSQTMNSRASSRTIEKEQFDGFLKFSETDKVHLMTTDGKEALVKRLRPIAKLLTIKIVDYSSENAVEIK
jgi:hypothetical protein